MNLMGKKLKNIEKIREVVKAAECNYMRRLETNDWQCYPDKDIERSCWVCVFGNKGHPITSNINDLITIIDNL